MGAHEFDDLLLISDLIPSVPVPGSKFIILYLEPLRGGACPCPSQKR